MRRSGVTPDKRWRVWLMDDGRSLKVKLLDMAFGIWRIA
jgi:hypothetical protein